MLTQQWTELLKDVLRLRLRKPYHLEVYRLWAQLYLLALLCYLVIWVMAMPLVVETPWGLPFRVYRDTFGPFSRLWNFEPVLLERSRYEQPDNMWAKLTFSSASLLGSCQDFFFDLWNWVVLNMVNGPWMQRLKAAAAGWCVGLGCFSCFVTIQSLLFHQARVLQPCLLAAWRKSVTAWVTVMPEQLLFLEQLYSRKLVGGKLSAAAELALAEYEEEVGADAVDADAAPETLAEPGPGADVLGRPAEVEQLVMRQR